MKNVILVLMSCLYLSGVLNAAETKVDGKLTTEEDFRKLQIEKRAKAQKARNKRKRESWVNSTEKLTKGQIRNLRRKKRNQRVLITDPGVS